MSGPLKPQTNCGTCGERGVSVRIEGGTIHSYVCTAEIVQLDDGTQRTIKVCPDMGRSVRDSTLKARSDK